MSTRKRSREEQITYIAERRRRVAAMTAEGMTADAIAAALRVTARSVARDRVALGIAQPHPPNITAEELDRARQLLDDGCSYNEVGRTLGRKGSTIARHLPGYGWDRGEGARLAMFNRWILNRNNDYAFNAVPLGARTA